jgi:hypothetical protein
VYEYLPRKPGSYPYQNIPVDHEPFYVGKGQNNRCFDHLKETLDDTDNIFKVRKIQSIQSASLQPIIIKVLETMNESEAYDLETALIKHWGRQGKDLNGCLTNIELDNRPPSQKGKPKSDEQKRKMSESYWKRVTQPDYVHPCKGKCFLSEEGRKKLSLAVKGNPKSAEAKRRCSETKKAMLADKTTHPMYGKSHSEESKRRMSETKKGKRLTADQITNQSHKWLIIPPTGDSFEITNLAQWCRDNKLSQGNMFITSTNPNKTTKGYRCRKVTTP